MIVKKRRVKNPINDPKALLRNIGENAKNRRVALGMRQHDVADRLKCSQNFVSMIESARKKISLHTLCALADVLECTYQQLQTPQQFVLNLKIARVR